MTRTERLTALVEAIGTAVRGKREVVEQLVVGLLAEGHVLIEDVPGVGKTTAARALADGRVGLVLHEPDDQLLRRRH